MGARLPRIDIVGAPGVGKTTLYRLLAERRGPEQRWLTRNEARTLALEIPAGWVDYLAYCEELAGRTQEGILGGRLRKLARRAAAADASDRLVLFDESITLRGLSLALRQVHSPERPSPRGSVRFKVRAVRSRRSARTYFQWMPPPHGVVHVTCEPEIITERLGQRGKTAPVHEGLEPDQIRKMTALAVGMSLDAAQCLRHRGSKVITVDMSFEPERVVSDVLRFLDRVDPERSQQR